ncbi:MAG: radical SAM protein, partial [bacterium]
MVLPLQTSIIYGPIKSRRLGNSLGINLLSTEKKICTFNCVYCQYSWTKIHSLKIENKVLLPRVPEVLKAVETALRTIHPKPAYITFSGNGEPTLHPDFTEIVDGVIQLRNRFAPCSNTAILTNSTQAIHGNIRKA